MAMQSDESLYSNYAARIPTAQLLPVLKWWHRRLLRYYLNTSASTSVTRNVLEIGPGHGFLAEEVTNRGWTYAAVDNSASISKSLTDDGYRVHLGDVGDLLHDQERFDVVWLSHVLEHSENQYSARQLLTNCRHLLADDGLIVVISPDILSWRHHFWEVDWSHGYQTSLRSTVQLLEDIGCEIDVTAYHRGGCFNLVNRGVFAVLSLIPHRLLDFLINPSRARQGDGIAYSWKAVFGWRQIFISAKKGN